MIGTTIGNAIGNASTSGNAIGNGAATKMAITNLAKNLSSVKWDKKYPLLAKNKLIQDTYNDWEDLFMVQMTLVYVSPELDENYAAPIDPDKLKLHKKMQTIVKAAFLQATFGTTTAAYLNMKDSGRNMFYNCRKIYKGASNTH